MNNIYTVIRKSLKWIWLFLVKACQVLRDLLSLLWPDKTITSRLCFGMAFLCVLVFVVNTFATIVFSCYNIFEEVNKRNTAEIKMARLICNQAEASEDSITVDTLFNLIREGGIQESIKISLVSKNDTILASSDSTWKGEHLVANTEYNPSDTLIANNNGLTVVVDSSAMYLQNVKGDQYTCTADSIAGTPYRVVLAQPTYESLKTIKDVILFLGKFSAISLLVLVVFYIIILASLRYQTRNNVEIMGELGVAKKIQQQMLINNFSAFPEPHGFDLHCKLLPAKLMGGDLYDYILQDEKLFFCVGDVSGKGVPAAIFMSAARVLFRHVIKFTNDPADIASEINRSLADGNDNNMFCTMFIGALDLKTNTLQYCNAGHNRPVLVKADGTTDFLETLPNLALGLIDDMLFVNQQLTFEEGMSLYVYTDGVTEAESVNKELFGDDRLLNLISENSQKSPKEVNDAILKSVSVHAFMADQSDDITMLCLKKNS